MEVSFSRDTYHTYMVITDSEMTNTEYEEKMMGNQQSAVLLPFHMQCIDGRKQYYYEITGKMDLRTCIEKRQADAGTLESLISCLVEVCRVIDEYLLNLNDVLISAEYLYVDIEMKRVYAAYIPGMQGDFADGLKQLTACLLEHTDHKDKDGVLLAYDLYSIVRQEDFTPGLLKQLQRQQETGREKEKIKLEENNIFSEDEIVIDNYASLEESTETELKGAPVEGARFLKTGLVPVCGIGLWMLIFLFYKLGYLQMVLDRSGIDLDARAAAMLMMTVILLILVLLRVFGKKIVLSAGSKAPEQDIWEDLEPSAVENKGVYVFSDMSAEAADRTVVLSGMAGSIRLISLNKNIAKDLAITKLPCILGSRQPDAEAVIAAVGISRKHAMIERKEDGIYLSDLNSTNGTFVNGERLKRDEKRKLLFEDMIALADVRYMYCGGEMK